MIRRLWRDPRGVAVAFGLIALGAAAQIVIAVGLVIGWWR